MESLNWLETIRDLKQGQLGPLEYELRLKKALLNAQLGDLSMNAAVNYNGNWDLRGQKPLWGGNLTFGAGNQDGNRQYQLQYERRF